jgi:acetyl-CoA acetyltransferase
MVELTLDPALAASLRAGVPNPMPAVGVARACLALLAAG